MGRQTRAVRAFGRKYVIHWDVEVRRFHVTLGTESIGFHREHDGAMALAGAHARCTTLGTAHPAMPFSVETIGTQPA